MSAPTQSISLYQLGEEFRALEQLAWESAGEDSPELEAWFKEYGELEGQKVDGYASFMRSLSAYVKDIEGELATLEVKRRVATKLLEKLQANSKAYLWSRRLQEVAGRIWKLCRQNNGGPAPLELLVPIESLPREYVKVPPPCEDGEALRAALKAAANDPGAPIHQLARFGERGWHVRVR